MGKINGTESKRQCLNCGAALAGEYCSRCGQRSGRRDLRFSDVTSELLGDLLDWDSRIWRTLVPLLFRPGYLTSEYMAGRRARYVPPLRLYLIISFILFLTLSFSSDFTISTDGTVPGDASRETGNTAAPTLDAEVDRALEELKATGVVIGDSKQQGSVSIELADESSPRWLQQLQQRAEENAASLQADPGAFREALLEYLPQMMFLLLPLFALLLKFAYLLSPFHYLQHLVFSLNYHSFAFLLFLIGIAVERLGVHYDGILFLLLAIYLPAGLWRAYGSSVMGAVGKALLIQFVYAVMMVLAFALSVVLALLLM